MDSSSICSKLPVFFCKTKLTFLQKNVNITYNLSDISDFLEIHKIPLPEAEYLAGNIGCCICGTILYAEHLDNWHPLCVGVDSFYIKQPATRKLDKRLRVQPEWIPIW